jgi:lipopolysaccharide export system permease protein
MKTLHLYLTRQVLASLLMTVMVFTFVLVLGSALKEILGLLVSGQATLGLVAKASALLIPFLLAFALPMGMLTATLLVFGRFSADQELTAIRASGVSLIALATPVLLLSAVLSALSALLNMQIAPQSRVAYKDLLSRVGLERSSSIIVEDRFMDDFPGYIVYVGKKDGTNLHKVMILKLDADGKMESRLQAARAYIETEGGASNQVWLRLFNVHQYNFVNWDTRSGGELAYPLKHEPPAERKRELPLSDMTFGQLQEKLRQLDQVAFQSKGIERLGPEELRAQKRQLEEVKADLTLPVRVQIHRQVACSFACIGFTLVGIPLGIRAHRRETTAGFAAALILSLIYYSFIIVGQSLETRPEWAPHLILWFPNFVFQAVGAVLLWRANRGI